MTKQEIENVKKEADSRPDAFGVIRFEETFPNDSEATNFVLDNPFFKDDNYVNYDLSIKKEGGLFRVDFSVQKRF